MLIVNPFKRVRYIMRTMLSPEEYARRMFDVMNDYNTGARSRFIMVTAFDERFTVKIEPGSLGPRGSGTFMKHFVVEAAGAFRPSRDGTVDVTIGFRRSLSLFQIIWRLFLVSFIAVSVWTLVASPLIPVLGVSFGVGIAPLFLLWSLIAFIQGMRQAARDWAALFAFIQTALSSHAIERV